MAIQHIEEIDMTKYDKNKLSSNSSIGSIHPTFYNYWLINLSYYYFQWIKLKLC